MCVCVCVCLYQWCYNSTVYTIFNYYRSSFYLSIFSFLLIVVNYLVILLCAFSFYFLVFLNIT